MTDFQIKTNTKYVLFVLIIKLLNKYMEHINYSTNVLTFRMFSIKLDPIYQFSPMYVRRVLF